MPQIQAESPSTTLAVLGPSEYHILLVLADGDRHGYGIMRQVETETGGRVRLGAGILYSAVKRLLEAGYIQRWSGGPADAEDDRRRKHYHLTRAGRTALAHEARRLEAFVQLARARQVETFLTGSPAPVQ